MLTNEKTKERRSGALWQAGLVNPIRSIAGGMLRRREDFGDIVSGIDPPSPEDRVDQGGEVLAIPGFPPERSTRLSSDQDLRVSAPYVERDGRWKGLMYQRDLAQRGFVRANSTHNLIRDKVLPRSVLGICAMLVAVAVGVAFSGAAFYAYYDSRLTASEEAVSRFVEGFDRQFNDAAGVLDQIRTDSVSQIRTEMEPLSELVANANGVVTIPETHGESVWALETRDSEGKLQVGSAFAVVAHNGGTAFVTSYSLVAGSTRKPAPTIELIKGEQRLEAQLWNWDSARDVALVSVAEKVAVVAIADSQQQVNALGLNIFAVSGTGGRGAAASPGVLVDNSQYGLQHTVPVGSLFVGGPLLDGSGRVVGVATNDYSPYGVTGGAVAQAPDVQAICAKILRCSETEGVLAVKAGE